MAKKGKKIKHKRHIGRGMHVVINGEEWILQKNWYEGDLQLVDIGTNNDR